jgi:hypothetical protein
MDLLQVEKALKLNKENIEAVRSEYERKMNYYERERKELLRLKALNMQGVDMDKVTVAEKILVFNKGFSRFYPDVIREAIEDIVSGEDKLRKEYFGIKDYDRFRNQEISCSYGCGPSHGSVVFSVGYTREYRENGLNDVERNACLYYLNLLLKSEEFRKNAKSN